MLSPIYLTKPDKDYYTEDEAIMLDKMHKEKIKLADAILVVNVNGYIGSYLLKWCLDKYNDKKIYLNIEEVEEDFDDYEISKEDA